MPLEGDVVIGRDASPSARLPGYDLRDPAIARKQQRINSFVVAPDAESGIWEVFGGAKGSVVMPSATKRPSPLSPPTVKGTVVAEDGASTRKDGSSAPGRMTVGTPIDVTSSIARKEAPCAVQTDRGGHYHSLEEAISARLQDMTNTVRDSPTAVRRMLSA